MGRDRGGVCLSLPARQKSHLAADCTAIPFSQGGAAMKPLDVSWHSEEESRMLHGCFSESNNTSDPPSDRIRRRTSPPPDGKPYVRPAAVQAEIEALFDLPPSAVLANRRKLRKETLVFFIREFRHKDGYA